MDTGQSTVPASKTESQGTDIEGNKSPTSAKQRPFVSLNIGSDLVQKNNKQFLTLNITNAAALNCDKNKPVLVLTNNSEKGIIEAGLIGNVMLDSQSLTRLAYLQGIHNILSDTQEKITKEYGMVQPGDVDKSGQRLRLYPCQDCDRQFSSEAYLKLHRNTHSGRKTLKCSYEGCDRKFAWPAHLKYHLLTHENKRYHKCPVCGKSFYTRQRLGVHLRTHTGEKPYKCSDCDKSFSTAGNLQNHVRTHTGEKPFSCEEPGCSKKFAELSSLKKHALTHSGKKPFSCDICGKTFSQLGSRNVHKKKHLSDTNKDDKKKNESIHNLIQGQHDLQQNVLVLRQDDDMLLYHDFQGSESVVYSPEGIGDVQVVTVTTQPIDGESDRLKYGHVMLGSDEVFNTADSAGMSSTGASVVVLSQPQEVVSMTTDYHHHPQSTVEEIVYDGDIIHNDLDHEEIASNIANREYVDGSMLNKEDCRNLAGAKVVMGTMMDIDVEQNKTCETSG